MALVKKLLWGVGLVDCMVIVKEDLFFSSSDSVMGANLSNYGCLDRPFCGMWAIEGLTLITV